MQNFGEYITNREIISYNDMDTSSDDYMEEEIGIDHFNLIKSRGSYRKYIVKQIQKLFDLIIEEGFTTKDATLVTGINIRTAQNYVRVYNNDPQKRLPGSYNKPRGRPCSKLTEEHFKCLVDYVKKNTTAVLDELKLKLCEKFEGLKISIFAIHKRLVPLRKAIVEQYKSDTAMDFSKNRVFIDEVGFNLHTQRNHGRSLKGAPAKSTVPTGKGVTFTILGAISQADIINIGLKKQELASSKIKERQMDQYIVMDNAPTRKPKVIKALIEEQGHKCIYLPPYSPFLNPIEEFWSKVKAGVRRIPLAADDHLTDRICESAGKVTKKDRAQF
ncbi:hypothetical protein G6F56_003614 [Rhizopus delemar]|nr:hypothetical protein G6F56_003614 [Rhizopus delemar]